NGIPSLSSEEIQTLIGLSTMVLVDAYPTLSAAKRMSFGDLLVVLTDQSTNQWANQFVQFLLFSTEPF
ncbi:MAG: hypothetical protein ACK6CE_00020, partial [Planctomycetota bacterium]